MIRRAVQGAAFLFVGACVGFVALVAAWPVVGARASFLVRSWRSRVAVEGRSMEPALESGDWLLVDPDAYVRRSAGPGELVLAPDPREPNRLLIKRVGSIDPDGRLELLGDAVEASTDSRTFGTIDAATVRGRPWLRYWPRGRIGPIS